MVLSALQQVTDDSDDSDDSDPSSQSLTRCGFPQEGPFLCSVLGHGEGLGRRRRLFSIGANAPAGGAAPRSQRLNNASN